MHNKHLTICLLLLLFCVGCSQQKKDLSLKNFLDQDSCDAPLEKSYQNNEIGFFINYPKSFNGQENYGSFNFTAVSNNGKESFGLNYQVNNLKYRVTDFVTFQIKAEIDDFKKSNDISNFRVVNQDITSLNDLYDMFWIHYEFEQSGILVQQINFSIFYNNSIYHITYVITDEKKDITNFCSLSSIIKSIKLNVIGR